MPLMKLVTVNMNCLNFFSLPDPYRNEKSFPALFSVNSLGPIYPMLVDNDSLTANKTRKER